LQQKNANKKAALMTFWFMVKKGAKWLKKGLFYGKMGYNRVYCTGIPMVIL
jgi:hypothetical protein